MGLERITVVEEQRKRDKNNKPFVTAKLSDGRVLNFMFDNYDVYNGLGEYDAEITKNGKFWNCEVLETVRGTINGHQSSVEPTKPINRVQEQPGDVPRRLPEPEIQPLIQTSRPLNHSEILHQRGIISSVATQEACKLTIAMMTQDQESWDENKTSGVISVIAEKIMLTAWNFITKQGKEKVVLNEEEVPF